MEKFFFHLFLSFVKKNSLLSEDEDDRFSTQLFRAVLRGSLLLDPTHCPGGDMGVHLMGCLSFPCTLRRSLENEETRLSENTGAMTCHT